MEKVHVPKEISKLYEELKTIPIMTHIDDWLERYDEKVISSMLLAFSEAYSGGQIESYRYGYAKEGYYSDIASAYPSVVSNLWDLTDSQILVLKTGNLPKSRPRSAVMCPSFWGRPRLCAPEEVKK